MKQYCCFDQKKSLMYILAYLVLQKPFCLCGYYVSNGNFYRRFLVVCGGIQTTYRPTIAFLRSISTLILTAITARH